MSFKNVLLISLTLTIVFFCFLIFKKQKNHISYLDDYNHLLTNQLITTVKQTVDINENFGEHFNFINNLIYNQDTVLLFESYLEESKYYLSIWIDENTCNQCLDELSKSAKSLKKEKLLIIVQNINPRDAKFLATKYNYFTVFQLDCSAPIWPYSNYNSQPILVLFKGSNLVCSYVPFKSNPSINQKVYEIFRNKME